MKRKTIKILCVSMILLLFFAFCSCKGKEEEPFDAELFKERLTSDIKSVKVIRDTSYTLNEKETAKFVGLLKAIPIYEKDPVEAKNSHLYSEGWNEMFTVTKKNGSSFTVTFFYPVLKVNGSIYTSDPEKIGICFSFYESIMREHFLDQEVRTSAYIG